jgi:NAD(P)-dependent dehydrogenase (short-subunit alcohol dehydrogenase family)
MKNRILLIGSGSTIAKSLIDTFRENYEFISFSREPAAGEKDKHYVLNSLTDDLPVIEDTLDGLVYFPGTIKLKPFRSLSTDDFLEDFEINFLGAARIIKSYLKNLLKSDKASVVLISSVAATLGLPFHSSIAASKSALEGFTRAMAAEYAGKIRFNAVAPSLTDTRLSEHMLKSDAAREQLAMSNPMKRIGNPSDISAAISFLLSGDSSWISGQVLNVDGGMSVLSKR